MGAWGFKNRCRKLFRALHEPGVEELEGALREGESPNETFYRGETALHMAVACVEPRCLEALLAAGADMGICNKKGDSPLSWARAQGLIERVKMMEAARREKEQLEQESHPRRAEKEKGPRL